VARRALLRASDAEREEVAERLRNAAIEGRLLAEELEERLATALRARTHGELDALVADLPAPHSGRRQGGLRVPRTAGEFALAVALAMVAVLVLIALALVIAGVFFLGGFWIVLAFFFLGRGRRGGWGPRPLPGPRHPYRYTRRSVYGPRRL
jgi:Flp pilus assembly protein TadB